MESKIAIILSTLLSFIQASQAQDVIDLGTLQVEGEVRRPPVQFYVSKKIPESILKKAAQDSFINLEEELLKETAMESREASPIQNSDDKKESQK